MRGGTHQVPPRRDGKGAEAGPPHPEPASPSLAVLPTRRPLSAGLTFPQGPARFLSHASGALRSAQRPTPPRQGPETAALQRAPPAPNSITDPLSSGGQRGRDLSRELGYLNQERHHPRLFESLKSRKSGQENPFFSRAFGGGGSPPHKKSVKNGHLKSSTYLKEV